MKINLEDCLIKKQSINIDGNKSVLFIVLHHDEIIASCMFFHYLTYPAWGQDFFVNESCRMNGVAKMLYEEVEREMKHKNQDRISGFVTEENLEFWKKFGFEIEMEIEEGFHIIKGIK